MAWGGMGLVRMKQGRYGEAVEHYRAALRGRPKLPEAHLNLAFCLRKLGQEEEADAALETALRLDPFLLKRVSQ